MFKEKVNIAFLFVDGNLKQHIGKDFLEIFVDKTVFLNFQGLQVDDFQHRFRQIVLHKISGDFQIGKGFLKKLIMRILHFHGITCLWSHYT